MSGEINHMWARPQTIGDILPIVQDDPNPNCDGTGADGWIVHSIGGISLI